jgi:branched-chain amino acid transport system substrate-binding protein
MKRSKVFSRALAAFSVLAIAQLTTHQAVAQGVSATTIKIGAYNALTGPIPLTAKQMVTGWRAAVQAVNDAGGIHGRKLELLVEDDGYEPSRALAASRKLVERDQVLLMTGLGTPTTVVAAKYLEQAKVPLLFPMGASSTQLNQAGLKQLFMSHPAYSSQAEIIVGYMIDQAGVKKPCMMYNLDPAGEDHLAGAKKAAAARNVPLLVAEGIDRAAADYTAPLLKAKNAGCDLMYTAVPLEVSARVVSTADRMDFRPKFAGFTSQADTTLVKLLGPLAEGFYAADMMVRPDADEPAVKTYLANLKKFSADAEPTFFVNYAYAAMMLIAEAIKDAGPQPTREKVLAALETWNPKMSPLMGPIVLSPKDHDGKRSLYMVQFKGGKLVKVSDWLTAK